MKAYFVTGTDTNIGKTTVSRALLSAATMRGLRTGCMKPVESGCSLSDSAELLPHDTLQLLQATNLGQLVDEACVYRLRDPVAPGIACWQERIQISLDKIELIFASVTERNPDFILMEGAGGMLVPIGQGRMVIDIAAHLQLPVLIVAKPSLGTINHTLLSIEAAQSRGLHVYGFIFCDREDGTAQGTTASNANHITLHTGVPYLGCLPKLMQWSTNFLAEAAERNLLLDFLL